MDEGRVADRRILLGCKSGVASHYRGVTVGSVYCCGSVIIKRRLYSWPMTVCRFKCLINPSRPVGQSQCFSCYGQTIMRNKSTDET